MAVGAALRLLDIGGQPLWSDEALTAVIAHAPLWALVTKPLDPSGPLYYLLHQLFVPASAGSASMRSISAVSGILIIPMTYALGRELTDGKSALFAAALVALSFPLIDYSQEARTYSLLTLLSCCAAWLALRAAREPVERYRRALLTAFAGTCIASLYAHLVAFILVGSWLLAIRAAVERQGVRITRSEIYAVFAAIGIAAVPEVRRMYLYVRDGAGFGWLKSLSPAEFGSLVVREWLPAGPLIGPITAAMMLALFAGGIVLARKRLASAFSDQPLSATLMAVWLMQPLILWLFSILVTPVLMSRTMLLAWPAFALALAMLLSTLKRCRWNAVTTILLLAYASSLIVTGLARQKEDWASVASMVAASAGRIAIICPAWKAPAFLAAMDRSQPAAVLTYWNKQWRLIERGPAGSWSDGYVRAIWAREMQRWIGVAPPARSAEITVSGAVWIESECSESEMRAAIAKFNGTVGATEVVGGKRSYNPALGEAAPILLQTVMFSEPTSLTVLRSN